MEPKYFRPYLMYHKNYDTNNPVMIPYETGLFSTKEQAKSELNKFANKFAITYISHKNILGVRCIDGFPYIMKRVGLFREVVVGYTNIGYVYATSDDEYSYLGFVIKRVGNTFRVYTSNLEKFIGLSAIDRDEMKSLNEALKIVDNIFHSLDHIRSILKTEVERKIEDVY